MSISEESLHEDIRDIFLNPDSEKCAELSLELAISFCSFQSEFLKNLKEKRIEKGEFANMAAYNIFIFRKRGFEDISSRYLSDQNITDCIGTEFFYPMFPLVEDRLKIHYCLSGSSNYVFVLLLGMGLDNQYKSVWRIVAGAIFSPRASGVILEYLGVSGSEYSIHDFYW